MTSPSTWEDVQLQANAIRPYYPRLAEMADRWSELAAAWLAEEQRQGCPAGHAARWVEQTGIREVVEALQRALLEPRVGRWLEAGIPEFGLGLYMAPLQDHEEQGIWVVDFPNALASLVRELDRTDPAWEP